jgi:hypothetical protein
MRLVADVSDSSISFLVVCAASNSVSVSAPRAQGSNIGNHSIRIWVTSPVRACDVWGGNDPAQQTRPATIFARDDGKRRRGDVSIFIGIENGGGTL